MSSLGHLLVLVFLYVLLFYSADSRKPQVLHDTGSSEDGAKGTRWAVLIAGSSYYYNYRHQVFDLFFYIKIFNHKKKR